MNGNKTICCTFATLFLSVLFTLYTALPVWAAVTIDDVTVSEDGTMTFTATSDTAVSGGFTVNVTFGGGTATGGGTDYDSTDQTLTFAGAVNETKTFTVNLNDDAIVESDETFTVSMATSSPSGVTDITDTATGTITDNDTATVTIGDVTAGEDGSMVFTAHVDQAVQGGFSVEVAFTDGTATGGNTDYDSTTQTLYFAGTANETQNFTVALNDDSIVEPDEKFTVGMQHVVSPGAMNIDDTATGTIQNDDKYGISISDASPVEEGQDSVFTITLNQPVINGHAVGVYYVAGATGDDPASKPQDYITAGYYILFSPGDQSKTVTIPTVDDDRVEGVETFFIYLWNPSVNSQIVDPLAVGTITDNDAATLTINPASINEDEHNLDFTVTSSHKIESSAHVLVSYSTADGSATAGSDYDAVNVADSSLVYGGTAGGTALTISVPIHADTIVEGDETFSVTLSSPDTNKVTVSGSPATGTILNDDKYPVLIYGGTDSSHRDRTSWGVEESHDMPFTIYIDQEPLAGDTVTVSFSTHDGSAEAGQDYEVPSSDSVVFSNGGLRDLPVNIPILEDALVEEPDEQFTVTLDPPPAGAKYYIIDTRDTVTGYIHSDDYVITYTATDGGSIVPGNTHGAPCGYGPDTPTSISGPNSDQIQVDNDKCQDFEITVAPDHELQDLLIDGVSAGSSFQNQPPGTYTYTFGPQEPDKNPRIIEAIFKHHIGMSAGANGTLSTPDGGMASAPPDTFILVNDKSTPTFTATADTCYHVNEFKVDGVVIGDPVSHADVNDYTTHSYTFDPVTVDHAVSVDFAIQEYPITTRVLGEHGQLTAGSTVDCGSSHTFTATADSGYHITWLRVYDETGTVIQDVTAAKGQTTSPVTVDHVTQALVVEAAFSQKIEVKEESPFGTISPDGGGTKPALVDVEYDDDQIFQIDAVASCPDGLSHNGHQHHISDILVDDVSIDGVKGKEKSNYSYTFSSVTENHTIEALFTSYVDVSVTGQGRVESGNFALDNASTGLVEDSMEVESGDDAVFTIIPATGYHVAKLEIDGVVTGYASSWTFPEVVDKDHTLKVWFEPDTYTLEPVSNFKTIFSDATLTTQAEAVGVDYDQSHTFYVKLSEPNNYDYTITVAGLLVDNIQYDIPTAFDTPVSKPDTDSYFTMERKRLHAPTDADYAEYLKVTFTHVKTSHRLEVLDYDSTPLADVPLDTRIRPQPAVIMFVLDDSGSMDWEFMTEEGDGLFNWKYYLYNISDKLYSGHVVNSAEKTQWKSQWSGYNKMFYSPKVTYTPWPTFFGGNLEDADGDLTDHVANANLDTPRSHPWYPTPTLNMNDTWSNFIPYTSVYSDEQVRNLSYDGDHYTESITIANDHSKLRIWTTYANGSQLDTMARVFVGNSVDNGNEYRWDEYTSQHEWSDGHYDDDSGYSTNASIELDDVPVGDYTLDITSYNGNSSGDFDLHVEVLEPQAGGQTLNILNAHYFAKDNDDNLYLVNISDPVEYYAVAATHGDEIQDTDLTLITDLSTIPEEVTYYSPTNYQTTPTTDDLHEVYLQERQNFVNWFSYYRKRVLASTAAVATFIKRVDNVKVGFNSINHELVHAPEPVDVVENMQIQNERKSLLTALYSMPRVAHGTPLRSGLDDVGHFYDAKNDGNNNGGIGDSPFADGQDGSECKQVFSIVMTDGYWNGNDPAGIGDADNDAWSPTLADVAKHYYDMDMSTLPDKVPDEGNSGQHMVTYTVGFGVKGHLDPAVDQEPAMDSHDWYAGNSDEDRIDDLWHAAVDGRGKFFSASRPDKLVASLLYIMEDIMGGRVGSGASVAINGDELFETIGDDIRIFQSSYDSDYWTGDVRSFTFDVDGDGNFTGNRTQEWSAQARLGALMNADGSNNTTVRNIVTWNPGSVDANGNWTGKGGISLDSSALTDEQQKYLIDYFRGTSACSVLSSYADSQEMLLSFLRGDRRAEICGYRERKKTLASFNHSTQEIIHDNDNLEEAWLGDFVDSKPIYTDGVLYAGANDGMLHAIKMNIGDADNGKELFAYMPNLVFDHVRELADPAYSHKFFVNGTPVTQKIETGADQYEYYLVGGLGKGGKGYYCLNITNAKTVVSEAGAAGLVKWEYPRPVPENLIISGANRFTFTSGIGTNGDDRISDALSGLGAFAVGTHISIIGTNDHTKEITNDGTYEVTAVAGDGSWIDISSGSLITGCGNLQDVIIRKSISDPEMGYSYGTPIIVKTNAKVGDPGYGYHGYVVIVANGYASEKGTASLKIINLETGELIRTIETDHGPFNGLSTPKAIDVNNDLKVDYVYAGDLLGNMWKFDLTSDESANWQVAFCDNPDAADHCKVTDSTNIAEPLFTASAHQAITGAPDVMRHQDNYGYMVIFGTGRYLGMPDLANTDIQSIYGIWDWAPDNWDKGYLGTRIDNVTTDPHVAELSNWTVVDVGGKKINTLLRQEIWCEGILKEDLNNNGNTSDPGENFGYYRIPSNYTGDWTTKKTTELDSTHPLYNKDLDGDGNTDKFDKVPMANLGWYFDLPGKISGNQPFSCNISDTVPRDLGERVTSDAVIRDGRAILISFMKEGDRCTGGLYSFINERDADNGGMPLKPVIDVNGDGQVNEEDLVEITYDVDGDGVQEHFPGVPTDKGYAGHLYGPVILQDKGGDKHGEETKYFSSSTEKIEKIRETAERRGVYFWQQVE